MIKRIMIFHKIQQQIQKIKETVTFLEDQSKELVIANQRTKTIINSSNSVSCAKQKNRIPIRELATILRDHKTYPRTISQMATVWKMKIFNNTINHMKLTTKIFKNHNSTMLILLKSFLIMILIFLKIVKTINNQPLSPKLTKRFLRLH